MILALTTTLLISQIEPCKTCWVESCRELKGLMKKCPKQTADCPAGQNRNEDTDGNCCWAGQVWKRSEQRCVGTPKCPADLSAQGEECTKKAEGRLIQERQRTLEEQRVAAEQKERSVAEERKLLERKRLEFEEKLSKSRPETVDDQFRYTVLELFPNMTPPNAANTIVVVGDVMDDGLVGGQRARWVAKKMEAALSAAGFSQGRKPQGWSGTGVPPNATSALFGDLLTREAQGRKLLDVTWTAFFRDGHARTSTHITMLAALAPAGPDFAGVESERDQLGQSDIMEAVLANKVGMQNCAQEQRRREGTSGKILMKWTVEPSGAVNSVSVVTEELRGSYMGECMSALISGMKFPRHKRQGEPVQFPFKF